MTDESKPEIDQDELVDLDDDLLEEVQQASGDTADEQADTDSAEQSTSDSAGQQATSDDAAPGPGDAMPDGVSIGKVYVRGVSTASASAIERYGEDDTDRSELIDEYQSLAEDLWLDRYFEQWWAENMGGSDDIPPGQMVVAMTGMMFALIAVEEPAVVDGLMADLGGRQKAQMAKHAADAASPGETQ